MAAFCCKLRLKSLIVSGNPITDIGEKTQRKRKSQYK